MLISKMGEIVNLWKQYHKNPLVSTRRKKGPYLQNFSITISLSGSCCCGQCLLKDSAQFILSLFQLNLWQFTTLPWKNVSVWLASSCTYIISTPTSFYVSKIDPLVYLEFCLTGIFPLLLINPEYLEYNVYEIIAHRC